MLCDWLASKNRLCRNPSVQDSRVLSRDVFVNVLAASVSVRAVRRRMKRRMVSSQMEHSGYKSEHS